MAVQNHVPTEAAHPSSWPVFLEAVTRRIIENDYRISREEAMRIGSIDLNDALLLFHYANQIREHYHGGRIYLCSIVNAKSGACSEDCAFCSQSAHFPTKSPAYALMQPDEVVQAARRALKDGAQGFSIVISGKGIQNKKELLAIGEIVKTVIREVGIDVHASVGVVAKEQIEYLKSCGVTMLHHNLETSERFFPSICTTHSYQERTATIRAARECGMRVCAGGIFGMGEDLRDRIDMAFELRELGVSAVPMNFLCPIKGTPLAGQAPLPPLEILSIISLYRFI
ncbi:MAG: biotin synthase BioB, partial [Candidatus Hinthialibacter sp.]